MQKPRPLRAAGVLFHHCRRVSVRVLTFDKIVGSGDLRRCGAANDRETGKKGDPTAIHIDFTDFPDVV